MAAASVTATGATPTFFSDRRPVRRYGMTQREASLPSAATVRHQSSTGRSRTPAPKNSPIGHQTVGASSNVACRTIERNACGAS